MNDLHDPYMKKGEQIYTGRVDSAKVFSGNSRVLLRYWTSDVKAKNLLIYWLSGSDSVLLNIPEKQATDAVDVSISNLPEGTLYFDLYTFNKDMKNRSVVFNTEGNVYGERYQQSLLNRRIKTKVFDPVNGRLTITWLGSVPNSIGCDFEFTDRNGTVQSGRIPSTGPVSVWENVASDFKYRTLFLPEEGAVDTFYTGYVQVPLN
ncbi:MAG: DUF4998 domain-containing protein [Mangrovibacterium sp.]